MEELSKSFGLMIVFAALLLWKTGNLAAAAWHVQRAPRFAESVRLRYDLYPRRCTALGLVNAALLFLVFAVAAGNTNPLGQLLVITLALVLCPFAYAPVYFAYGRRWNEGSGAESGPDFRTVCAGGLWAEAVFMAPILGQALSVLGGLRGLGALSLALFARTK